MKYEVDCKNYYQMKQVNVTGLFKNICYRNSAKSISNKNTIKESENRTLDI